MEDENNNFNDPLSDIDPVMDDAFSVSDGDIALDNQSQRDNISTEKKSPEKKIFMWI